MKDMLHTRNSEEEAKGLVPWRTLESREVYRNAFLNIRQDTVELPSGRVYSDYFVTDRTDWAAVFCLSEDGSHLLLNRQYRHGIGRIVYELPAGGVDKGETPAEGAIRELREETGYRPIGEIEHLGRFIMNATSDSNEYDLFYCRGVVPCAGRDADNDLEIIQSIWMPLAEVAAMIKDGRLNSGPHVGLILLAFLKKGLYT